jgi:hypothetical protein
LWWWQEVGYIKFLFFLMAHHGRWKQTLVYVAVSGVIADKSVAYQFFFELDGDCPAFHTETKYQGYAAFHHDKII